MVQRALLVGLDVYPDPRNNLNSCVADTLAFKGMLQSVFGFDPANISLLHNSAATLSNVLEGLKRLMNGAQPGDQLVYFESSHGYRYPDGDTMVEVLCLYDKFLKDTDFIALTQAAPPDVLTVCLDSCHSGGMNKLFFPDGDVQVARAKVWTPTLEDQARYAQLYQQVTKFKFFANSATSVAGAVAKNLYFDPKNVAMQKDPSDGAPELNGALFAACQADQTAAAGTPATNNLSAFTYALIGELDRSLSLSDLGLKVARRLDDLNMQQVPRAVAPMMHPELLTETFITMQTPGGTVAPDAADGDGAFDPFEYLRSQLSDLIGS
jgi:hypothetical protein